MSLSLLPVKQEAKPSERMCQSIGRAYLLLDQLREIHFAVRTRPGLIGNSIAATRRAIEQNARDAKQFEGGLRLWSKEAREEGVARVEEERRALVAQLQEQTRQRADAQAQESAAERAFYSHDHFIEALEKFLREKLRNQELLTAVESLKTQIAGKKVKDATLKIIAPGDPAMAKLLELRAAAEKMRAEIAAMESAPLPADDMRQIVAHVMSKARRPTSQAEGVLHQLRAPSGRYSMPDQKDLAYVIWESVASKLSEKDLLDCIVARADSLERPAGMSLSERGAHLKRLRTGATDIEREAAVEADRLESTGAAVVRSGKEDVAVVVEVWQREV